MIKVGSACLWHLIAMANPQLEWKYFQSFDALLSDRTLFLKLYNEFVALCGESTTQWSLLEPIDETLPCTFKTLRLIEDMAVIVYGAESFQHQTAVLTLARMGVSIWRSSCDKTKTRSGWDISELENCLPKRCYMAVFPPQEPSDDQIDFMDIYV